MKEKESVPPDDLDDEEQKKRHLNVVFIGHVGKGIVLKVSIFIFLSPSTECDHMEF